MAKYHTVIFETIRLSYTGPSVDKPLLFSFVFLFGGGGLFKMSKMIFAMNLRLRPPAEMKKAYKELKRVTF